MNIQYKFIEILEQIDDFYLEHSIVKDFCDGKLKDMGYKTYKEYFKNHWNKNLSNVKIDLIKTITKQDIENKNPFKYFYYLDKNLIERIFYLIAYTHKAIEYYDSYSKPIRDYQEEKKVKSNQNAIKNVLELILASDKSILEYLQNPDKSNYNDIPIGYKVLEYLENLEATLSNIHYTELNIYQNIYFELFEILHNKSYKESYSGKTKQFSKSLIVKIVNQLIEIYYQRDFTFTEHTDLTSYIKVKYNYHTQEGITLTHKATKKSKV